MSTPFEVAVRCQLGRHYLSLFSCKLQWLIKTNLVYFSYDIKNDDRKSLVPLQVDNQIMNRGESYENSEEDSLVC